MIRRCILVLALLASLAACGSHSASAHSTTTTWWEDETVESSATTAPPTTTPVAYTEGLHMQATSDSGVDRATLKLLFGEPVAATKLLQTDDQTVADGCLQHGSERALAVPVEAQIHLDSTLPVKKLFLSLPTFGVATSLKYLQYFSDGAVCDKPFPDVSFADVTADSPNRTFRFVVLLDEGFTGSADLATLGNTFGGAPRLNFNGEVRSSWSGWGSHLLDCPRAFAVQSEVTMVTFGGPTPSEYRSSSGRQPCHVVTEAQPVGGQRIL